MVRKEHERHEKKLRKQLDKQQKKLAQKGIHVDLETLKREYLAQRGLLGREQVQNFFLYFFILKILVLNVLWMDTFFSAFLRGAV